MRKTEYNGVLIMHCEFELCAYNKDLSCNREGISLDDRGICHECAPVSLPDEILIFIKEKHFRKLMEMYKKSGSEK